MAEITCPEICGEVILFVLLEVTDFVFDWEFVVEIFEHDKFKNDPIRRIILGFAVPGTMLFTCALLCLSYIIKNRNSEKIRQFQQKWDTLITCLTTVFEDVPQMVLAVIVAQRTKEPITHWVQYTKAGLGIVESLLRISLVLWRHFGHKIPLPTCSCCKKEKKEAESKGLKLWTRIADVINVTGYLTILVCAVTILGTFAA